MKKTSLPGFLVACTAFLALAASASANHVLLTSTSTFPTSGTATQTDRLSRNGIPQDFSGSEAYPGINTTAPNTTGTFNYITFTLTPAQLAGGPYVQIELNSQGLGLFASAYVNSYVPPTAAAPTNSFQTNYLGDEGSSGNYDFTTLPLNAPDVSFFGVDVPVGDSLVIVLSTAGTVNPNTLIAAGAGDAYSLEVENFSTTEYGPITNAPEPSAWLTVLGGAALLGGVQRLRRMQARRPKLAVAR